MNDMTENDWPKDKAKVRAIVPDKHDPDDFERFYVLLWWKGGRKQAQCFWGPFNPPRSIKFYTWDEIEEARKEEQT